VSGREMPCKGAGKFIVVKRTWNSTQRTRYSDYSAARQAVMDLRSRGFAARIEIEGEHDPAEEPEYGRSRRKFLIAMFMCGAVRSDRVVERIAAEVNADV